MNDLLGIFVSAWSVFLQEVFFEGFHETWNLFGDCEREAILSQVDFPVLPGPSVYWAKPDPMNPANIVYREPMVAVIKDKYLGHCPQLFSQFDAIHFALLLDAKQISKNTAARSGLVLALYET
jgi:hypothetical protein